MRRILVVDDNDTKALVNVLYGTGEITPEKDAATAIELIEAQRFDLLLLDYILSGTRHVHGKLVPVSPTGRDVLIHARKSALNRNTPTILLSGAHDSISINDARELRCELLAKPCLPVELLKLVSELLTAPADLEAQLLTWSDTFGPREAEFFVMKVKGVEDEECAVVMHVKPATIEDYRKHVVRKVNARRRAEHRSPVSHFADVLNIFYRGCLGLRS